MRRPWNGNLAWCGVHKLAARKFFDQIGIDRSRFEERDTMLKALTVMCLLVEHGLSHSQRRARILERMKATRPEHEVITEIENGRAAHSGNNK